MSDQEREIVRATLHVTGRQDRAFFCNLAQEEGMRLGLSGEARNLPDGSAEAIVEGERRAVDDFIAWCRQAPAPTQVAGVDVKLSPPRGEFRTFMVAR